MTSFFLFNCIFSQRTFAKVKLCLHDSDQPSRSDPRGVSVCRWTLVYVLPRLLHRPVLFLTPEAVPRPPVHAELCCDMKAPLLLAARLIPHSRLVSSPVSCVHHLFTSGLNSISASQVAVIRSASSALLIMFRPFFLLCAGSCQTSVLSGFKAEDDKLTGSTPSLLNAIRPHASAAESHI